MDRTEDEILIAIVDRADFERAREMVAGFEQWTSYDDYRCEREGRLLGLSFAGQTATLAPVSLGRFLAWSRSTGAAGRGSRLRGSDRPTEAASDAASSRGRLARLDEQPSEALLDAYARLIADDGAESPRRASAG